MQTKSVLVSSTSSSCFQDGKKHLSIKSMILYALWPRSYRANFLLKIWKIKSLIIKIRRKSKQYRILFLSVKNWNNKSATQKVSIEQHKNSMKRSEPLLSLLMKSQDLKLSCWTFDTSWERLMKKLRKDRQILTRLENWRKSSCMQIKTP